MTHNVTSFQNKVNERAAAAARRAEELEEGEGAAAAHAEAEHLKAHAARVEAMARGDNPQAAAPSSQQAVAAPIKIGEAKEAIGQRRAQEEVRQSEKEASTRHGLMKQRIWKELTKFNGQDGVEVQLKEGTCRIPVGRLDTDITQIEDIAAHIKQTGAKNLTLIFPVQSGPAHYTKQSVTMSVEELSKGGLVEMLATKALESHPNAASPLKAVLESVVEKQSFRERVSGMSKTEKAWTGVNAVVGALMLYEAVRNFSHARQEDPLTGEKKTNWSAVTWGAVSAGFAGLSAIQVASALKGGMHR